MKHLMNVRDRLEDLAKKISEISVIKPDVIHKFTDPPGKCLCVRQCQKSGVIRADEILPVVKELVEVLEYIEEHPYVERIVEIPEGYSLTLVKDE